MRTVSPQIWLLGLGMLGVNLVWQTYNLYIPIFLQSGRPDFAQSAGVTGFALNPTTTGAIMTLDNIAAMLILPYIGVLSDRTRTRFGRRLPFLMLGAPLAAAAFAAVPWALSVSLPLLLTLIAVVIIGMDLFRTPLTALMADLTPPERRSPANGVLTMMYNLGFVLASVFGSRLFGISPGAPFLFASIGLSVTILLILLLVREPAHPEAAEETLPTMRGMVHTLLRERESSTRFLLGAVFVWSVGTSALEIFFTSFAINQFQLDSGSAAQLMAFFGVAGLVGAVPAGLIGMKIGRKRAVMTGLGLLIVLLGSCNVIPALAILRIALIGMGLSWALVTVNALPIALDQTIPERGGAYAGLFFLANQAASVVGPVLAGGTLSLAGNNYRAIFLYIPFMMFVALLLMNGVRRGDITREQKKSRRVESTG